MSTTLRRKGDILKKYSTFIAIVLFLIIGSTAGYARVTLSALPSRDRVFVNLADPSQALVQETRTLPLQAGVNDIDFSWEGVNLDPDSVRMILPETHDRLTVLSISYPPDDDALVWHVYSESAEDREVTIRYRLRGFQKDVEYRGTVGADEQHMDLQEYVYLYNHSGEDFSDGWLGLGFGNWLQTSWENGESKKMSAYRVDGVPFEKTYTYDVRKLSTDPNQIERTREIPVHYRFGNRSTYNLGDRPLEAGKIRVFQRDPRQETVFTGEDSLSYVPKGDSIAVYIGDSRDLKVKQNTVHRERMNVRRDNDGDVELFDLREVIKVDVENFKKEDVVLRVIQTIEGEWEMVNSTHSHQKQSNEVVLFRVPVEAQGSSTLRFEYIKRHLGKDR